MDELSDFSSEVVEFLPTTFLEKQTKFVDCGTLTDALPPMKNALTETNPKCHVATQTKNFVDEGTFAKVDEKKLAEWLRKVYPAFEAEMRKGITPLPDYHNSDWGATMATTMDINIQTYQKISLANSTTIATPTTGTAMEHSQGLATWLTVHTNNAPVLVVTIAQPHDDWCEHVNQRIHLFVPKRVRRGDFVVFTETKTIPIKACLKFLTTNRFDKSLFVGSAFDGDIYIWRYDQSTGDINELFNFTTTHGFASAMDWSALDRLLICHSNGYITQWAMGKEIVKENEFLLRPPIAANAQAALVAAASNEITTLVCQSLNDFVVGTKDGGVYHCWSSNVGSLRNQLETTALRRHQFMVTSLLRTNTPGFTVVISCDLSGEVIYHDLRNSDDDSSNVIVQIPLPFKNTIACSRDGQFIYCHSLDGALDCYSLHNGDQFTVKGALRGKGNFIKCSDNGNWIITGSYMEDFQIFYVDI